MRIMSGAKAQMMHQLTIQQETELATLRAENERLRAALEKIDLLNTPLHGWSMSDLIDQEIVASGIRAALAGEKQDE